MQRSRAGMAMASPSKQRNKRVDGESGVPRRVTRSQSREVEERRVDYEETRLRKTAGRDSDDGLEAVAEESTLIETSPQKPRSRPDRRSLDDHEDPMNMTGTTLNPPGSEPETELDPIMMRETIPDLDVSAKGVLDLLTRHSKDPLTVVKEARARTQKNPLKFKVNNLNGVVQYFSTQTYIDVDWVNHEVLPILSDGMTEMTVDLSLYRANCARFALELLLAGNWELKRHTIDTLQTIFPAQFINGEEMDRSLLSATFNLALEIRTQSLVMTLESRKLEANFDPLVILEDIFYADEHALRGFGVDPFEDEDGYLPEPWGDVAQARFDDIRAMFAESDDDSPNVDGVKASFPWKRFCLQAVRWIWSMGDAIEMGLSGQKGQPLGDVQHHGPRDTLDGTFGSSFARSSMSGVRARSTPQPRQTPTKASRVSFTADQVEPAQPSFTPTSTPPAFSIAAQSAKPTTSPSLLRRMAAMSSPPKGKEPAQPHTPTRGRVSSSNAQIGGNAQVDDNAQVNETAQIDQPAPRPSQQELSKETTDRRKSIKGWVNFSAISRIKEREERLAAGSTETHQAMPSTSQDVSVQQATQEQPPPEASQPSSPNELFVNDSVDMDDAPLELEKSMSPLVPNREAAEDREQPNQETQETQESSGGDIPFSASHVWNVAMQHKHDNPAPKSPRRSQAGPTSADTHAIASPSRKLKDRPADNQRRFIDRQDNARRVSDIDETSDTQRTAAQKKKRTHQEIEDSEDEFTEDRRDIDVTSKRAQKPYQSPSKRQRVVPSSQENDTSSQLEQDLNYLTQPNRPNPAVVIPAPSQPSTQSREVVSKPPTDPTLTSTQVIEIATRVSSREYTSSRRSKWTDDQNKALIEYIGEIGAKWSQILKADGNRSKALGGGRLEGKNQGQVKDRTRNMRNALIREGVPESQWPKNFDQIPK